MNTVRLSITIPLDIAQQLDELVGPKKKSRFITETLRDRLQKIRTEQLQKILAEGYRMSGRENLDLAEDFELIDLEG